MRNGMRARRFADSRKHCVFFMLHQHLPHYAALLSFDDYFTTVYAVLLLRVFAAGWWWLLRLDIAFFQNQGPWFLFVSPFAYSLFLHSFRLCFVFSFAFEFLCFLHRSTRQFYFAIRLSVLVVPVPCYEIGLQKSWILWMPRILASLAKKFELIKKRRISCGTWIF